jgi:RNA polymerase sigma-70 factor (ECF subfamily)
MLPEVRRRVKRKIFIQKRRDRCLSSETVNENGEQHWCEALYDAKASELVLYGRALGLSHGEAEDALQETFVALMQLSGRPEKTEHYLVRSFRNRALNYRRSLWRRLTREWEVLADGHHWFEKSPDEDAAERALQTATVRALETLPLEQREVIVLKIWSNCTFEEIGGLLEISPHTAAGRYRYGLQKIRNKLKGVSHERIESAGEHLALLASAPSDGGTEAPAV